jgi:hypothetical protein
MGTAEKRARGETGRGSDTAERALHALFRSIAARERDEVLRRLRESPQLAAQAAKVGASRTASREHYLEEILHYVYAGDTALHIAAAAYQAQIARALLAKGAAVRARNRHGAEPLHYAADGIPGTEPWNPKAQGRMVELLIEAGADPNALDRTGAAPLHRAIRTRCTAAVRALLEHGADPELPSSRGSTPLALAKLATGRGGSGSPEARAERTAILELLRAHRRRGRRTK